MKITFGQLPFELVQREDFANHIGRGPGPGALEGGVVIREVIRAEASRMAGWNVQVAQLVTGRSGRSSPRQMDLTRVPRHPIEHHTGSGFVLRHFKQLTPLAPRAITRRKERQAMMFVPLVQVTKDAAAGAVLEKPRGAISNEGGPIQRCPHVDEVGVGP